MAKRAGNMKASKILLSILGGVLLIAVLTIGACIVVFWSVGDSLCGSEIFQEVFSPDGKHKVVVFQRDCGATTGFRTHISVFDSGTTLKDQTGNIFQADGYPDWFSIKVTWIDDQHIVIEHNGKPIPDVAKSKVGNIEIQYVENTKGIVPPRSFMPNELLLPVSFFPGGWTGEELRPLGPEEIKGSNENNPYMLYTPQAPADNFEAGHYVTRLDNADQAIEYYQRELGAFKVNHSESCVPSNLSHAKESIFISEYSKNYAVGYAEHRYSDGSGKPECMMIAQYDEFFIEFRATISENGLTYEQFNNLVKIIDKIMTQHLQQ
jgi:hypothetical protein